MKGDWKLYDDGEDAIQLGTPFRVGFFHANTSGAGERPIL